MPHAEIAAVNGDARRGRIAVTTGDGTETTFKQVATEDVPVALRYIENGRGNDLPAEVAAAVAARMAAPAFTNRDMTAQKQAAKEAAKKEREARDRALAGQEVAKGFFAGQTVQIYHRGYARLSSTFSSGPLERLMGIEVTTEITKKTGVGRAVGLVASGGLSMFTPNRRGDIYLMITTDRTTHVLHQDPPTDSAMKTARKLEAAGRAVLEAAARTSMATAPEQLSASEPPVAIAPEPADAPSAGVAERLQQLEALREAGLVTHEEYQQKRTQILDAL